MKLYYSAGACSLAAHIVAHEAGLAFDPVKVNLKTHTTEAGEDFYKINPRGYVPALVLDDGELVTEASVVVQYLADQAPQTNLLPPAGSRERLRVQEWLAYVATELHKTFSPALWRPDSPEATKQAARDKLATRFAELDRHLASQDWLTGDTFTVADAYAFCIINWANFLKLDLSPYPNLQKYMTRVASRPKTRDALLAEKLVATA